MLQDHAEQNTQSFQYTPHKYSMRLHEFANNNPGTKQKLADIKMMLDTTDNDDLLDFVEVTVDKAIEEPEETTEAPESDQQRQQRVFEKLAQYGDPGLIDYIEGAMRESELSARVDRLYSTRGWDKSRRMLIYKAPFFQQVMTARTSLRSKIELLYMLTRNTVAIPSSVFNKNFKATLDDITPSKIVSNPTYQQIKNTIFFANTFRGKGIGPGEFALALLGKNGLIVDDRGDVDIEGFGIEIKHGAGGSIKTGSPTKFRAADKLRDFIGKQVGRQLDSKNKIKWDAENEFTQRYNALDTGKKQQITKQYIEGLYPEIAEDIRNTLIKNLMQDAGTMRVRDHFGKALLASYKQQDDFNTILFIKEDGTISNIADVNETEGLVDFALAGLNRDGDTQALPDGYINGKVAK